LHGDRTSARAARSVMGTLTDKRILVLEDEYLLAMEAADVLRELGAIVVGPAHRLDTALGLLATDAMDAALLDVNIGGGSSRAVAERLVELGVPFVFATGYGTHADVPAGSSIVDKPYTREQIEAALLLLFSDDRAVRP
jgi:CheY-like chemotaxis protein